MRKIYFISFPRSGHHLVMNTLFKYFSRKSDFALITGDQTKLKCKELIHFGDLSYCEYYNHCRKTPCLSGAVIQKNHDFNLEFEKDSEAYYIILYRDPLRSIYSYYNLSLSDGSLKKDSESNISNQLESFFEKNFTYWRLFIEKWVMDRTKRNRLVFSYNELMEFPMVILTNVISFIDPSEKIDFAFLTSIIKELNFCEQVNDDFVKLKKNSKIISIYESHLQSLGLKQKVLRI